MGTSLQIETPIMEGKGVPSSTLCLRTFMDQWVEHYGYPKVSRCDRDLHNRGTFYMEMAAAGVQVTNIGLEAPYQLGRRNEKDLSGRRSLRRSLRLSRSLVWMR